MLSEHTKRKIRLARNAHWRAKESVTETAKVLAATLKEAREVDSASLAELGILLGVSRQRIHQMLKENE
jgi:DNA-binding XRE family transcriptional regulator